MEQATQEKEGQLPLFSSPTHLIHGVYTPAGDIFDRAKAECAALGVDFGQLAWRGSCYPPVFKDRQEVTVYLEVCLDSPEATMDCAWDMLSVPKWRWGALRPDRIRRANKAFHPWTKAWRRVNLAAIHDRAPSTLSRPETHPSLDLLFALGEHPEAAKAGMFRCFIPGLEFVTAWGKQHTLLTRRSQDRQELYSEASSATRPDLAIPEYV